MKIAIIVRTYSKRGGISGYAAELAESFAKGNDYVGLRTEKRVSFPSAAPARQWWGGGIYFS
ncbi:MAG: hypothetical protein NT145_03370 [Elusimicrobia bacterium]|nr:hypothetical protein [Elusimicrobiota bacterium]